MGNGKHVWGWFVVFMIAFWSTPIFISVESTKERIQSELSNVNAQFGELTHNKVVENSNALYQAMIIDTGLQGWILSRAVTTKVQSDAEVLYGKSIGESSRKTNGYLSNALANFYGLTLRVQLLAMWIPLVVPFLLGAVVDGYATRKIKLATIGFFSPTAFSASSHILIGVTCLPLLYLITPIVMSPFWVPLMAVGAAVALRVVIRNAQRFSD